MDRWGGPLPLRPRDFPLPPFPDCQYTAMNPLQNPRSTLQPAHLQRLKTWVRDGLGLPPDTPISIAQLQCHEPGCAPLETVISVLSQPPQTFKLHKPAEAITKGEVAALMPPPEPAPGSETVHQ